MKQFVTREATGVFVWSLTSCVVRMFLSCLVALSKLRSSDEANNGRQGNYCSGQKDGSCLPQDSAILEEIITVISVLSGWVLAVFPSKVANLTAPGFSFGSTWVIYPLRDYFGFIPNLPCRICETTMGRLTLRELAMILPIHFLVPAIAFWSLQLLLPAATFSSFAIDPVIYSERNPWAVDFMRETLVNALFTVGLLVIPELLRINGVRRGYALLALYPLYSFSVDADGKASAFGPNVIYSLMFVGKHEEVPITQWSHLLGPILGGILGGKIMSNAFPDDK